MDDNLIEFLEKEKEMLDRAIVATPSREYLEGFASANKGTSDLLLMQMAINFGYELALKNVEQIYKKEK